MTSFLDKPVHCLRTQVLLFLIFISIDFDALLVEGVEAARAEVAMQSVPWLI